MAFASICLYLPLYQAGLVATRTKMDDANIFIGQHVAIVTMRPDDHDIVQELQRADPMDVESFFAHTHEKVGLDVAGEF